MAMRAATAQSARGRQQVQDTQQAAAMGCVLVVMVGLFVAAYRWGSGAQQQEGSRRSGDLKKRGDYLRDQLRSCQSKTQHSQERTQNLKGESGGLWQNNKQLEEENERLVKLNEELEKKSIECVENSELQKQTWSDEDKKNARVLNELDRRNKELRSKSKRLSSVQGMRTILLLANIKKLGEENRRLRERLELPVVEPSDEYVTGLVEKWKRVDKALADAGQQGPMSDRAGVVLKPNGTEFSQLLRRPRTDFQLREDSSKAKKIFFQQRDSDGSYPKPTWNGRAGTQRLKHGVSLNAKYTPTMDITRQLRILYEYALCAMGNNITRFMYPTTFKSSAKQSTSESLHEWIDTPLVQFCDDCRPQHNTGEFKLLCQGYSSEDQYGSFMFWRMRSRLRFRSRLLKLADKWMTENGYDGAKTLAVRLKWGDFQEKCQTQWKKGRPQLSYLRLLKGRAREIGSNFDEQCFPPVEHAISAINTAVAGKGVAKVYISTDATPEQWEQVEKGVKVPMKRLAAGKKKTEEAVVDIIVASRMEHLLVNRYDIVSTHMVEYFLLENKLRSTRISVW